MQDIIIPTTDAITDATPPATTVTATTTYTPSPSSLLIVVVGDSSVGRFEPDKPMQPDIVLPTTEATTLATVASAHTSPPYSFVMVVVDQNCLRDSEHIEPKPDIENPGYDISDDKDNSFGHDHCRYTKAQYCQTFSNC
jgi:hypothetical protein